MPLIPGFRCPPAAIGLRSTAPDRLTASFGGLRGACFRSGTLPLPSGYFAGDPVRPRLLDPADRTSSGRSQLGFPDCGLIDQELGHRLLLARLAGRFVSRAALIASSNDRGMRSVPLRRGCRLVDKLALALLLGLR
jgi:hypothetical protein